VVQPSVPVLQGNWIFTADASVTLMSGIVLLHVCSVALGQSTGDRTGNLQDILRLLTLWFTWGSAPDVEAALQVGLQQHLACGRSNCRSANDNCCLAGCKKLLERHCSFPGVPLTTAAVLAEFVHDMQLWNVWHVACYPGTGAASAVVLGCLQLICTASPPVLLPCSAAILCCTAFFGFAGGFWSGVHRYLVGGHPSDYCTHPHKQPTGERLLEASRCHVFFIHAT